MPRSSLLNIPYEGTRTVEPGNLPVVWQSIHVEPDMFGAGKGQALAQLGHAIGSIGETIGQIDQKNQLEQADTMVKQADTQAMKDMTELREEYRQQDPEKAAAGFDDFDKRARAIADKATASVAGNKHAKKIMGNHAEGYYQDAWKFGFGIKTEGVRRAADLWGDKRVDQVTESATTASDEKFMTDPDRGVLAVIDGETFAKGQRNRWTPQYTAAIAAERKSLAINKFISGIARSDAGTAQIYRDKYDEHLSPGDKKLIDDTIKERNRTTVAPDRADAIFDGQPVPPSVTPKPLPPASTIVEPPKGPGGPGYFKQKQSDYNTKLSPSEEKDFAVWKGKYAPNDSGQDYDLRGAFKAGAVPDDKGHMPDTWKKPNHPTFSDQSQYATGADAAKAGHWDGDTFVPPKQKKSETEGGTIQLASGGTIEFSAQQKLSPYNKPGVPIPGYHPEADTATVENYIAQQARLRGIDPGTALAVYKSEGADRWRTAESKGGASWGPYQLYTGLSLDSDSGLGNSFYKDLQIDPRDPKNWRENVEYALNKVVEGGWGPWSGAKKNGITGKQGVGEGARTIPVGASSMYKQSQVPESYDEEPTVAPNEPAKNYGKTYATETGERDAMRKPGSNIFHAYNTYGKIRTLPPDPRLESAIDKAAADAGVTIRITSGGQTHNHDPAKKDTPGGWTGSHRHDDGKAVDLDIMDKDGKVLARSDPRRLAFLEAAAKYGAGGTGAGYMDDSLKVHVGITGASGKVGQGLGPYAGNEAERQAVYRGLQGGGHDASTQFAQHGGNDNSNEPGARVRLASASSGTMSDAPQPGYAGAQVAQAGYQPPPSGASRGPLSADTTKEELNAIIKSEREAMRGAGWDEDAAKAFEARLRQRHDRALQEKADRNKRSYELIGDEIKGDPATNRPGAENYDNINRDPALFQAWKELTPDQRDIMNKAHKYVNSSNAKREPTLEDIIRYRGFLEMRVADPELFKSLNFHDPAHNMPLKLANSLLADQKTMINKGIMSDPYRAQTYKALEMQGVQEQLKFADMPVTANTKDFSPRLKAFLPHLEAEIRVYMEQNKKVPNPEEVDGMVNRILRTSSRQVTIFGRGISKPFTGEYGKAQDPLMETVREFEVPLTKDEQDVMVKEFKEWYPDLKDVKSVSDISAARQAYWKVHRRLRSEDLDVYDVRTGR